MRKQWSESAVEQTQAAFEELSFSARVGKVWLKQSGGDYGYINDDDALRGSYTIHSPSGDALATFDSIPKLLEHGWVLD